MLLIVFDSQQDELFLLMTYEWVVTIIYILIIFVMC